MQVGLNKGTLHAQLVTCRRVFNVSTKALFAEEGANGKVMQGGPRLDGRTPEEQLGLAIYIA